MVFDWGFGEPKRKTWYFNHAACVRKVYRYLKAKYTEADYERKLVEGRITDAYGYNQKTKTHYVCEVKVKWDDLQKAVFQVTDTTRRLQKKHKKDTVVPVLAIPGALEKKLRGWGDWQSLRRHCRETGVKVWIIESGGIRQAR